MPESRKDNSISVAEIHHQPPENDKILETTNKCLNNEIMPKQAFEQLAGPEPVEISETETTEIVDNNSKQDQQEIKDIKKEIEKNVPSSETLINKDEYYLQKEKDLMQTHGGGFIDSHKTQYENYGPNYENSTINKIKSVPCILKLKASGVENANDFYQVLHQRGFKDRFIADKSTINNLKGLSTPEIATGIDRINKLGFRVIEFDFLNPDYRQTIKEISHISDTNFNAVTSELNPYFFLNENMPDSHLFSSHKDQFRDDLLNSIKKNQIDPEIKKRLELFEEVFMLKKTNKGLDYLFTTHITDNGKRVDPSSENIFNKNNQISFKLPERDSLDEDIFKNDSKFIYQNIDSFQNPTQLIERLSPEEIIELPGNKNGIYGFLKEIILNKKDSYTTTEEVVNYIVENKDKITTSLEDKNQRSKFIIDLIQNGSHNPNFTDPRPNFINNLKQLKISELVTFSEKNDQNYWELISTIKNQDFIKLLIDQKDQFFDELNFPKPLLFETIIKNNKINIESYDFKSLSNCLDKDSIINFSPKDKVIWSVFRNILYEKNKKEIFISQFDEISKLVNETDNISPEFLDKTVEIFGNTCLTEALSEDVLKSIPPQEKVFWTLYKDITENTDNYNKSKIDNLFNHQKDFTKYFDNKNNLNSSFFEMMVTDINGIKNSYLTKENIQKIENKQDQIYWKTYKDLSLDKVNDGDFSNFSYQISSLRDFLLTNKNNFSDYLTKDNKLNSAFMMALVKTESQCSHPPSFEGKSILSDELLNNITPSEKPFWTSYRDADIYNYTNSYGSTTNVIREILLEKKEDYQKFFNIDGYPTPLLFETAALSKSEVYYGRNLNLSNISDEVLNSFSDKDKAFWTAYRDSSWINGELFDNSSTQNIMQKFLLENHTDFSKFLDQNNNLNSFCLESFIKCTYSRNIIPDRLLTDEKLSTFSDQDKRMWQIVRQKNGSGSNSIIINNKDRLNDLFDDQNFPTLLFLKLARRDRLSMDSFITSDFINNRPQTEIKFWQKLKETDDTTKDNIVSIIEDGKFSEYLKGNNFSESFLNNLKEKNPDGFVHYLIDFASKEEWKNAFDSETIDNLLNSLPIESNEKRNAFTHNDYDRTSEFLKFLKYNHEIKFDHDIKFDLDKDNLIIASNFIEKFGLSKTPILFQYFKNISDFNQGKIESLSPEQLSSGITTIDQLQNQVNEVKQLCLSAKPIENLSDLSPLQLNLLSVATGHSSNRFTRVPIETIINDFSQDLADNKIVPLSPTFKLIDAEISKVSINLEEDLSKNIVYQNLKKEILSSLYEPENIDSIKSDIIDIFQTKTNILSLTESNDFIKKQIESFTSYIQLVNESESVDSLFNSSLTFNLNLGKDKNRDFQGEFNSALRQLVFRKTLIKHQSPEWRENLRNNLENNNETLAVADSINFLNNFIKDHALNLETNNNEGYWDKNTFENMKKYSKVLKSNLSIGSYIKELQEIEKKFQVTKSDSKLQIEIIPDRGLIGEMSGYMADVCYTGVYPLLKQYPNLVPYKFVSSPESDNPELMGSTLVFQVPDANNEPTFLIRAFNIPQEQSLDIGPFFEKFVDSLSNTAKELGVKKIIAAGTAGTISNYSLTTNYVISNYVTGKNSVPLKDKFNFNDHDITNACYLVRDLS